MLITKTLMGVKVPVWDGIVTYRGDVIPEPQVIHTGIFLDEHQARYKAEIVAGKLLNKSVMIDDVEIQKVTEIISVRVCERELSLGLTDARQLFAALKDFLK